MALPRATTLGMPMNPLSTWWPAPVHPSLLNVIHLMAKGVVPTFNQHFAPPDDYKGPAVAPNPGSPTWAAGELGTVPAPRPPTPPVGPEGGLLGGLVPGANSFAAVPDTAGLPGTPDVPVAPEPPPPPAVSALPPAPATAAAPALQALLGQLRAMQATPASPALPAMMQALMGGR
jgi:hypothetical protein